MANNQSTCQPAPYTNYKGYQFYGNHLRSARDIAYYTCYIAFTRDTQVQVVLISKNTTTGNTFKPCTYIQPRGRIHKVFYTVLPSS